MRIGNLAEQTGTPVETIRFYEREGLLPAAQHRAMSAAPRPVDEEPGPHPLLDGAFKPPRLSARRA